MEIVGQIIGGNFSEIIVRQKSGKEIELGDLFVADIDQNSYVILEVFDLLYGSQIGESTRELIAGMKLEGYQNLDFFDKELSNYTLARLKILLTVSNGIAKVPKKLPEFFSEIRPITENDLKFLSKPYDALYVGKIRSGSKIINADVFLQGKNTLKHHVFIAATTGRGKSNLVKVMAASAMKQDFCSFLILDPHDEYYGRNGPGLKDYNCIYYSLNPLPGTRKLIINIEKLKPWHLDDVMNLSDAQIEAMYLFYNEYKDNWVSELVLADSDICEMINIKPETLNVLQRKFNVILGIRKIDGELECTGVFDINAGRTTISDICSELENGKNVIIDTSMLSSEIEILIGSMIAKEIFNNYKQYKMDNIINKKPIISIVLEEAPRVLNADSLERKNIFTTIAREGRKFNIGLIAITQLPSLIPKEILANMNTKIILGIELVSERNAVIESAAQDLSKENRNIASLDIGEAIVTSSFTKFAIPISIPKFEDILENREKRKVHWEEY
ncbi:MAG: ATP-binding protein [Candidatus Aenigmatarchaeota archaeon]